MRNAKKSVDGAAWLAVLMEAQKKGDSALAARARHELERLGVKVAFADRKAANHAR